VNSTTRNVLIVLVLAAAVAFLPGAGLAGDLLAAILSAIFFVGLVWFAGRLYLEHRYTLDTLGERWRLVLYGSLGLAVLTITATSKLWDTGPGTLLWIGLIALASYGLYATYRSSRQY
jgi:hypothetical protein